MKKSEMTVSMPLTTYESLNSNIEKLKSIIDEVKDTIKSGPDGYYFDTTLALNVIKKYTFTHPENVTVEKI